MIARPSQRKWRPFLRNPCGPPAAVRAPLVSTRWQGRLPPSPVESG
jgi:hypothetical protein